MNFFDSIKAFWINYANFKGRTSRTTYWWTVLFLFLAGSILTALFPGHTHQEMFFDHMVTVTDQSAMEDIWGLVTLVPSIAMLVRRLHDTGKSAQWLWWLLFIFVGWVVILVQLLSAGTGSNKYGEPVK